MKIKFYSRTFLWVWCTNFHYHYRQILGAFLALLSDTREHRSRLRWHWILSLNISYSLYRYKVSFSCISSIKICYLLFVYQNFLSSAYFCPAKRFTICCRPLINVELILFSHTSTLLCLSTKRDLCIYIVYTHTWAADHSSLLTAQFLLTIVWKTSPKLLVLARKLNPAWILVVSQALYYYSMPSMEYHYNFPVMQVTVTGRHSVPILQLSYTRPIQKGWKAPYDMVRIQIDLPYHI